MKYLRLLGVIFVVLGLISCQKELTPTSTNVDNSSTAVKVENSDEKTNETIEPFKNQLDEKMNQVIGYCPQELIEGEYQSPLGNFVIDLVLVQSEKKVGKKIDMAVVTNGGLRSPIQKGDVTVGNIYELMPFDNEIVILELQGESIIKMMHYAVFKRNAVFAGITYEIKYGQTENIRIGGKPFDYDKIYTLAVSDYLAGGGDKMTFLTEATKTTKTGLLFRDAIINHIRELTAEGKEIVGGFDNRVIRAF